MSMATFSQSSVHANIAGALAQTPESRSKILWLRRATKISSAARQNSQPTVESELSAVIHVSFKVCLLPLVFTNKPFLKQIFFNVQSAKDARIPPLPCVSSTPSKNLSLLHQFLQEYGFKSLQSTIWNNWLFLNPWKSKIYSPKPKSLPASPSFCSTINSKHDLQQKQTRKNARKMLHFSPGLS